MSLFSTRPLTRWWALGAAIFCLACNAPPPTEPARSPDAPRTMAKSALMVVGSVNGTSSAPDKVFYRFEVRNASDVRVSFAGQTLHLTNVEGPATVTLGLRKGPTAGQVTADLSAENKGSSSKTSVNVGGGSEKDFRKLLDYEPAERPLEGNKMVPIAQGIGAFPSLYVEAKAR